MKNCFSNLGRSQGGQVKLTPFFQPRYSTVLNEKYNNLPSTFSRYPAVNYYSVTVPQKREFCEFQLHCIEFNVPGTNFSIKQPRGKKRVATEPNKINSILNVFATTEQGIVCLRQLIGEKMLVLRLRTSATRSAFSLMFFSSLRSDHQKRTII